jgi:hypothetical protein
VPVEPVEPVVGPELSPLPLVTEPDVVESVFGDPSGAECSEADEFDSVSGVAQATP